MPQAGNSPLPTGRAKEAAATLGQEDAVPKPSDRMPPAGPHADPKLMNPDATPGAGALTPSGEHDDVDSTSG